MDTKGTSTSSDEQEDSILRKLLKVNKKAAVVMVSDMLLGKSSIFFSIWNAFYKFSIFVVSTSAGVDTVS